MRNIFDIEKEVNQVTVKANQEVKVVEEKQEVIIPETSELTNKYSYILEILKPEQVKKLIESVNNILTKEQKAECVKRWKEKYCALEVNDLQEFDNLRSEEIKRKYFKVNVEDNKIIIKKCKLPFFGKVKEEVCKEIVCNSISKLELIEILKEYDIKEEEVVSE